MYPFMSKLFSSKDVGIERRLLQLYVSFDIVPMVGGITKVYSERYKNGKSNDCPRNLRSCPRIGH